MNMIMIYLALIEEESYHETFVRVYNKYRLPMVHVAMSVLDDFNLAEDAVHNGFIKVAKNIQKLDFARDVRAFLFTVAKNEAISILRKLNKERTFIEKNSQCLHREQISIEEDYENKADAENVAQYIAQLPDDYAAIFTLRFQYQFKTKEIAALLDLSDDVVRKRVQRMKQRIEKLRDKEEW